MNTQATSARASCPKVKADGYAHHPYDFDARAELPVPGRRQRHARHAVAAHARRSTGCSEAGALRKHGGGQHAALPDRVRLLRVRPPRAAGEEARRSTCRRRTSIALKNPRREVSSSSTCWWRRPSGFESAFFNTGASSTSKNKTYPQYRSLKRWYSKNRGQGQAAGQRADLGARRPARPIARWAARAEPLEKPGASGWPALGSTSSRTSDPTAGGASRPPRSRAGWTWCSCATSEAGEDELRRATAVLRGALCDEHGALLWLNDRPDLALACGRRRRARGPGRRAAWRPCARRWAPELLVGLSTHSPAAARAGPRRGGGPAQRRAGLGDAHEGGPPGRRARLRAPRRAPARLGAPWFAIGGIDLDNVRQVIGSGRRADRRGAGHPGRPGPGAPRPRHCAPRSRARRAMSQEVAQAAPAGRRCAGSRARRPRRPRAGARGYSRSRRRDDEARAALRAAGARRAPRRGHRGRDRRGAAGGGEPGRARRELRPGRGRQDREHPARHRDPRDRVGRDVARPLLGRARHAGAACHHHRFRCLALLTANNLAAVVLALSILAVSGTLFRFLVKAMARLQMPTRPGA